MVPIRVLIVDDAVVVRRLLSDIISKDRMLEVVGTAANGKIALSKIPTLKPHVIVLDLEMPVMDGLQTLDELKRQRLGIPVIAFSATTLRGAKSTFEALAKGAVDYVTKPSTLKKDRSVFETVELQLIPRLKTFGRKRLNRSTNQAKKRPSAPIPQKSPPARPAIIARPADARFDTRKPTLGPSATKPQVSAVPTARKPIAIGPPKLLTIGTSTGGPNALTELLSNLRAPLPVPVLIVQHMPPLFTKILAERLSANTGHKVLECVHGTQIEPGQIWVAPGNFHMVVTRSPTGYRLRTHQGKPENSCRPAVDVLFRSVAEAYGPKVLALVLTGMGCDGLQGCQKIYEAGGQIMAQDQESSVVWGMPGFVAKEGLASVVAPLPRLAEEVSNRLMIATHRRIDPKNRK